jgi:hypothetical protein
LYHGFGLYPLLPLELAFVLPSMFRKSRFVKRRLTRAERLTCFDFPESLSVGLTPTLQLHLLMHNCPEKCLFAAFAAFRP